MKRIALLLLVMSAATARADHDEAPPHQTPFDRGRVGLSIGGGRQTAFNTRYFVVGGGVGYFVLDGVELGLSGLYEFGSGPAIAKLSPSVRYIAQPLVGKWPIIPYVGAFFNHWFIGNDLPDVDTVGTRGGLLYVSGQIILGLGIVVEREISTCTVDCTQVYPDFTISLAI